MIQCVDHLNVKKIVTTFVHINIGIINQKILLKNDERYESSVFDTQYNQDVYQVIARCIDSNIESDRNYYDCKNQEKKENI